jgi:hypothetical protein
LERGCPAVRPSDSNKSRASWIGGQGLEPYEQKTQQSPGSGISTAAQFSHA